MKQIFENMNVEEAAQALARLRDSAPYRFGGVWYLTKTNEGAQAFRTRKACEKCAHKHGFATIGIFGGKAA